MLVEGSLFTAKKIVKPSFSLFYLQICKVSLSYHLCFEYFSKFKIDSETYTYLAAVLKDGDVSKQVKLPIILVKIGVRSV